MGGVAGVLIDESHDLLFTSDRVKMGEFTNPPWIKILAWITAGIIVALNVKFLLDYFGVVSWLAKLFH